MLKNAREVDFFSRFSLYTIDVCVCVRELVCVMVIMFSLIVT